MKAKKFLNIAKVVLKILCSIWRLGAKHHDVPCDDVVFNKKDTK